MNNLHTNYTNVFPYFYLDLQKKHVFSEQFEDRKWINELQNINMVGDKSPMINWINFAN